MMNWSVLRVFADKLCRRPAWIEDDGDQDVIVQGYSILDSVGVGFVMVGVIAGILAVIA